MDKFTEKRFLKFVQEHREKAGQMPTFKDLSAAGFTKEMVAYALKQKLIVELYVTLTNGAVACVYKINS